MNNAGKYYEVGQTFKEGDVELKVVNSGLSCYYGGCLKCWYNTNVPNCNDNTKPICSCDYRPDYNHVHFEEINAPTTTQTGAE